MSYKIGGSFDSRAVLTLNDMKNMNENMGNILHPGDYKGYEMKLDADHIISSVFMYKSYYMQKNPFDTAADAIYWAKYDDSIFKKRSTMIIVSRNALDPRMQKKLFSSDCDIFVHDNHDFTYYYITDLFDEMKATPFPLEFMDAREVMLKRSMKKRGVI